MVYFPTGREEKAYNPESVVVCVLVTPVASFFAVTVAPGTTAPFVSRTEPVMLDVPVCASAAPAQRTKSTRVERIRFADFNIGITPEKWLTEAVVVPKSKRSKRLLMMPM